MNTSINISLNNGDKVYVRGMLSADKNSNNCTQFTMTGKIAASGNCNALWSYQDLNAPLKTYCGFNLFSNCTSLTTAPELPATTLANDCYHSMFYGCTSLVTAPELPATTLANGCYWSMFERCTSLTVAPEILPATTLSERCYIQMFQYCTSLVTAPELPATTLAERCYRNMFRYCTKLNYIKCLATNISDSHCTDDWVKGVSSNGAFVKHPNMTSWSTGSSGIPSGWTVENADI